MSGAPQRVLVLWADSKSPNFGVRVLADGMAELARRAWGEHTQVEFQDYGAGDSPVSFGTRSILRDIGSKNGPIRSKLAQYDLVLDSGAGDSFADIYGMKRLLTMAYAQNASFRAGIPIVMGPQTIGPFNSRLGRVLASRSLHRMTAVLARDGASASYAAELGRPVDCQATDVVFALPCPSVPKSRDIVLNVSGLLWFSDAHVGTQKYRTAVRSLAHQLVTRGRRITLLAHTVRAGSDVDDRSAITALAHEIPGLHELVVPESLDDVRSTLASASVVVGARMHACLNALSVGTPAIPWAYSRKFRPLMEDIGWRWGFDLRLDDEIVERTIGLLDDEHLPLIVRELDAVRAEARLRLRDAVEVLREVANGT